MKLSNYILEKFKITKNTKAKTLDENEEYYTIGFTGRNSDLSDDHIIYTDSENTIYLYGKAELKKLIDEEDLFNYYGCKFPKEYYYKIHEIGEKKISLDKFRPDDNWTSIYKIFN